jgi:hypothetical protein
LTLFVVACLAVPWASLRAQGGSPTKPAAVDPDELARLAPRLDSRRTDIKSFEVKGSFSLASLVTLHCVSAVPRRACVVLIDQVPFFVAADDQVLVYDALSGPHLWHADWRVFLGIADGKVSLQPWIFDRGNTDAGILIDLPALVERAREGRTVTEIGGSRYQLTASTPTGGQLEAWIDLSRSGRYSRLTARAAGQAQPFLDVSIVSVDESIDPRAFVFPRFADYLPVPPPTELTGQTLGQGIQQIGTQGFFHYGLHDPAARTELERKLGHSLDWSDLQQREAAMAPLLRRAIEADSALRAP